MPHHVEKNLSSRVGCHCWGTSPASVATLPLAAEAGCRWVRATRPMQLEVVSTGPRRYDFAANGERSVDAAVGLGMSVLGILDGRWGNETLVNKVPWASPVWEHLDLWEDFTAAAVGYYKGRVKFWEVINEPPFFWWYPTPEGVTEPEQDGDYRRAPVRAYAELLKATARAVRAADPGAKVLCGSGFSDGAFLRKLYQLGCRDSFDVASVHYLNCRHPADFGRAHRRVRQVMAEFGDSGKPLWDTETGPGGAVIGHAVPTAAEYEGLYNVYRHCLAHECGLERYFWFNPPAAGEAPGEAPTPRYRALKAMHDFVGEGGLLGAEHYDGEAHLYVFDGPRGPVSLLWSTAPARARLPGRSVEGADYLGGPVTLAGDLDLTGRPLFIPGDLRPGLDVTVGGRRETVTASMKQPPDPTPAADATRAAGPMGLGDGGWERVPYVVRNHRAPGPEQAGHFCRVPSAVAADLQIAFTDEDLLLRVRTYDGRLDRGRPTGLVQFTVRDGDPGVAEWPYFTNGYGLFNLFLSKRGPMVLRYETLLPDEYPAGRVEAAALECAPWAGGLLYAARVPWREVGPCRPGRNEPFLMTFTFTRADNLLDVPEGDEPEEWSHNFADTFIVKPVAVARWVRFGGRQGPAQG